MILTAFVNCLNNKKCRQIKNKNNYLKKKRHQIFFTCNVSKLFTYYDATQVIYDISFFKRQNQNWDLIIL